MQWAGGAGWSFKRQRAASLRQPERRWVEESEPAGAPCLDLEHEQGLLKLQPIVPERARARPQALQRVIARSPQVNIGRAFPGPSSQIKSQKVKLFKLF